MPVHTFSSVSAGYPLHTARCPKTEQTFTARVEYIDATGDEPIAWIRCPYCDMAGYVYTDAAYTAAKPQWHCYAVQD